MSEVIHCEILPPDASDAVFEPQAETPETTATAPLDEIELREGPYLQFTRSGVKPNLAAIAQRCAQTHDVAWCEQTRTFLQHSAGVWVPLSKTALSRHVSCLLKKLADDRDAPGLIFKRSPSLISSVLELMKGCSPMGEAEGAEAQLVPLKNGVLDLSGDEPALRDFEREDYFKARAPINWVLASPCKRWLNHLLIPALKHKEDLDLLQRVLGSMLIAGNPAQVILLLLGIGGSGKSTVVSVIESIMGLHRVAHLRTDHITTRFETHFYQGKDLLVAKDVSPQFMVKGGASLKWLTGNDRFETEQKYGGKSEMTGNLNVIVTANEAPPVKVEGDAEAWVRRILPVEFTTVPAKRVANFDKVLVEEEGAGILRWLVEGYLRARAEIREHGFFVLSEGQKQRRSNFVDGSQNLLVFVQDIVEQGQGDLSIDELYHEYAAMCRTRGWAPLTERKFQNELPQLMLTIHGTHKRHDIVRAGKHVRGYRGLKFVPAVIEEAVAAKQKVEPLLV